MKWKPSSVTEGEDEDTSISLNGGDTLSPMHHGNRNMHFLMMATYCDNTNVAITSDTHCFTHHICSTYMSHYNDPFSSLSLTWPKLLNCQYASHQQNLLWNHNLLWWTLPFTSQSWHLVARNFASHPTSTATLRHYRFLSLSIDRLELDLERHRLEQQAIFTYLMKSRTFQMKIQPIVDKYQCKACLYQDIQSSSPFTLPSFNNHVHPPPTADYTSSDWTHRVQSFQL